MSTELGKFSRPETVPVKGLDGKVHNVPAFKADDFRHSDTGLPLTDAEYDETQRRLNQNNDHLIPEEFR